MFTADDPRDLAPKSKYNPLVHCMNCGIQGYPSRNCPQPQKTCNHCLKVGHIEKYCLSLKAGKLKTLKDSPEHLEYLRKTAKKGGKGSGGKKGKGGYVARLSTEVDNRHEKSEPLAPAQVELDKKSRA
jgi:hypothetical protein